MGGQFKVDQKLWKPVPDDVYLQEINGKVVSDQPVTSLALFNDAAYAVVGGGVSVIQGEKLQAVPDAPKDVLRVQVVGGSLWALAKSGLYQFADGKWRGFDSREFVDLCVHQGAVHAATRDDVFRIEKDALVNIEPKGGYQSNDSTVVMADGTQVLADPVHIGPISRLASYCGTLYVLRPNGLALLDGRRVVPNPIDWGTLPSRHVQAICSLGSCLYITTDKGLAVLRGMAMTTLRGQDGLPYEDTTCVTPGFDGDLWIGTTRGAIRKTRDEYQYLGAQHWLPGNNVHDIAVGKNVVYVATDKGIGVIRYEPFTLQKKADYFEKSLSEWGMKRLGFIHMLYWSGDKDGWLREISDNDGGHTAHYLAAMSFKYAATGDEKAREQAVDAFKAMIWLEEITKNPGFIARAVWANNVDKGQRSERGSGGLPAKWYYTPDKLFAFKGDTSSDEVDGHFYSVSIFHDLAAKGPEKDRAAQHLARIASHIMDHGWVLQDMDGKPTRWGRWDPEYLLRPYGYIARGLNGMQAQTYMRAAYGVTGDAKYEQGFQQLVKWGYPSYTVRQKLTFPPDEVVPSYDELAFRCYYTLLRFTDAPEYRSIYLRSITRSWEVKRMEHVPWFNFIYGAATGNDCEVDRAAKHLREWSLDLRNWSYENSFRSDLAPEPGYVPYQGGTRAMSPRETTAKGGSRSALEYDGGGSGRSVTPPIGWLEDYWMGRYHGFIEAPKTQDAALLTVDHGANPQPGAKPYDGPPRPSNLVPGEP
ncbi:MAG: hypothetical protein HZB26_22830 [Candidatus Hydrogenedentes bacterium]|nr:hypothetical protein [Candidatus Hydrogenedentota bacterium]